MQRKEGIQIVVVALPEAVLAAALALYMQAVEPPQGAVAYAAWMICACYGGLMLIGLSTVVSLRLPGLRRAPSPQPEREAASGEARAEEDAGALAGAGASDSLPLLAVPTGGRDMREAVIAFAQRYGMRPYEADSGFVLADAQGQHYRVTTG